MASNIVSQTIDAAYPVAGVDNDTQGFRDNFQIIKTGLATAASEITSLQDQTVKVVDNNNNVVENDFRESSILNASLDNVTFKLKPNDSDITVNTTIVVDAGLGHYQVFSLGVIDGNDGSSPVQFSIENWPVRNTNDGVATLTLHIYNNGDTSKTLKFIAANSGAIYKADTWPTPAGDTSTDDSVLVELPNVTGRPIILEFWSYDAGQTVYANHLGIFRKSSDA